MARGNSMIEQGTVDMSSTAVTRRLHEVAELWELGMKLVKARRVESAPNQERMAAKVRRVDECMQEDV